MGKTAVAEKVEKAKTEAPNSKERIYEKIRDYIENRTDVRFGVTASQELFNLILEGVFTAAAKDKSFRFNGGLGALHIRKYAPGQRTTPRGQVVTFGERFKMRYEEGVVTAKLVATGGDEKKVFGDRVKPVKAPVAKVEKPEKVAKPAKAASTAKTAKDEKADVELE